MKKKTKIVIPIAVLVIVIGIVILIININSNNAANTVDNHKYNFNGPSKMLFLQACTKDGILGADNGGNLLTITDYNTGKCTVLCNKPDCKHDNNTCPAYFGGIDALLEYNDKLYLLVYDSGKTQVIQADKDGTNRKVLTEFKGMVFPQPISYDLLDNKIYFVVDTFEYSYTTDLTEKKYKFSIKCYDLKTNEVSDTYVLPENYHITMQNLIVNDDIAIISYTYCTKPRDYYTDKDTQQYNEELCRQVTKSVTFSYNVKTKETKELFDGKGNICIIAYKDNYVYFEEYENNKGKNALFKMDLNTGKTETVLTNDAIINGGDGTTQVNVLSNEILLADKKNKMMYFYDINGNLKNTLKSTDWYAVNEYEDFYLLVDKNGYGIYNIKRFINKEDYIAGLKDYKVAGLPKDSDNFNN